MAMEDVELTGLTDEQTDELLKSESPLADIYKDFSKIETEHMDVCAAVSKNAPKRRRRLKHCNLRKR